MGKIEELYQEWQNVQPIKDEYLQRLNRKFMLEFNYNSNHTEEEKKQIVSQFKQDLLSELKEKL